MSNITNRVTVVTTTSIADDNDNPIVPGERIAYEQNGRMYVADFCGLAERNYMKLRVPGRDETYNINPNAVTSLFRCEFHQKDFVPKE